MMRVYMSILLVTFVVAALLGIGTGTAAAIPLPASTSWSAPAQLAPEDQRIRKQWEDRGRPNKMVIVRDTRIDVVTDGQVSQRVPSGSAALNIAALDRMLMPGWLTITDGTADLAATIVLTRGTALDISDVRTLRLTGGASTTQTALIYTGGGRLSLRGVTVTSFDTATGKPVSLAPGRPSIVAAAGGRLEVTDSTISEMGTPANEVDNGRPAVAFNPASSGSLVRTTLLRNSVGVELSRSDGVRLEGLTVAESAGDGIVFSGDRGTTMTEVHAERNGRNGLLFTMLSADRRPVGSTSRPVASVTGRRITGVATNGNGEYGLVLVGQQGAHVIGVATTADKAGGLRVSRSNDTLITGFTATDQPVGLFTHINTTNTVLDGVQTTGGRRGVVAEKSTQGLTITGSTFKGARVAGISVGGQDVQLTDVRVSDSGTGVRIERGARRITLTGLTLVGGNHGVVATPNTAGVVVRDLVADNVAADAVRTFSPNTRIIGGRITGGATAIDVAAATTISGTIISHAREGIRTRSTQPVHAHNIDVTTSSLGINAAHGSPFTLTASRVHALEAVRGQVGQQGINELSLPPLNLLGAIGIPLILLAFVLEQVHVHRLRRAGADTRRRPPPAYPPPAPKQ